MKTFISNVDTPFGHSLCRLLSVTGVGSRAEDGGEEEEEIQLDPQTGEALPKKEKSIKDNYYISGTLLHSDKAKSHKQVNMIESGDKKKGLSSCLHCRCGSSRGYRKNGYTWKSAEKCPFHH
jgi:hypothetical protein